MTYTPRIGLALGAPARRFRPADIPDDVAGDVDFEMGRGRFMIRISHHPADDGPRYDSATFGRPGGRWSPQRKITLPSQENAFTTRVAFGPGGRTLVAYVIYRPFDAFTLHTVWVRDGRVTRRQTIGAVRGSDAAYDVEPTIDEGGNATITWIDGKRTVRTTRAAPGGEFTEPRTIWRSPSGVEAHGPAAAAAPTGAIVAWAVHTPDSIPGGPDSIRAVRLRAGRAPGKPEVVGSTPTRLGEPLLGLARDGRGAIAWLEAVGDRGTRFRIALR